MAKTKIEPIKIAIIAVGGDGGGVLTQWIVKLAEKNNYWAQSTTIAGVAQRTGSTVYYIELVPLSSITIDGKIYTPILAQMPEQGKVDLLIATEILEAGRAIQRGFVSNETTMIFSTHRNLAIQEKETPGDGISNGEDIFEMTKKYAKTFYCGNFKLIAEKNHSVISASLLGAIAGSNCLPFDGKQFQEVIIDSGVGVKTSLNAFRESLDYVKLSNAPHQSYQPGVAKATFKDIPPTILSPILKQLVVKIEQDFPAVLHQTLFAGVTQVCEWQNKKWAIEYLNKVKKYVDIDSSYIGTQYELSQNIARYLAIAMTYDDLVNVADLKTREDRWHEVYQQVEAKDKEVVQVIDYLHPGYDEVVGFLPKPIGRFLSTNKTCRRWFVKYLDKDRRMNTHKLVPFLMLYIIGGMRRYRMFTFRHDEEMDNINYWFKRIDTALKTNYDLAIQIAKTYRLKKGYGDTYARGDSKFKSINEFAINHKSVPNIHEHVEFLIQYALKNHKLEDLQLKIKTFFNL